MNYGEMLAVKIIEINRQHTPTPRLCSSRAKRVEIDPEDQAKSRIYELSECIRIISKLFLIPWISGG